MSAPRDIKMHTVMAIDPGVSGAVAVYRAGDITLKHMPEEPKDMTDLIAHYRACADVDSRPLVCVMERVNGFMGKERPGSRMFTMGENYGFSKGLLSANGIPVTLVQPTKWQRDLGYEKEKGTEQPAWKRKLREHAQALYPQLKVTIQDADALLLLHWARIHLNIF